MSAKGISFHIGLNAVDANAYQGWGGQLRACEADADSMLSIAKSQHYASSSSLLTKQATADRVLTGIKQAAPQLESGDLFLLTYSGHGGLIPDPENPGKQVDTWVLYDRMIIGHELYRLWNEFASGVRIFVTSDSCHSGFVIREELVKYMRSLMAAQMHLSKAKSRGEALGRSLPHMKQEGVDSMTSAGIDDDSQIRAIPPDIAIETYTANKDQYDRIAKDNPARLQNSIKASVLLISGCQENQTSADGARNGLFTATLLSVWDNGKFSGNYKKFQENIVSFMPDTQTPNYFSLGANSGSWLQDKPFVP